NVASTVTEQARSLFDQTTSELGSQAGNQQQRLAEGLRSLAQQFGSMAEGSSDSSGQATGLVREASQRTETLASWLEQREPGDVLEEVRRFARRRPGAFIAIAAGVGVLAGRMTRGLTSGGDEQGPGTPGYVGGESGSYAGASAGAGTGSYAGAAGVSGT